MLHSTSWASLVHLMFVSHTIFCIRLFRFNRYEEADAKDFS